LKGKPSQKSSHRFLQQSGLTSGHGYQNRVHLTIVMWTVSESIAIVAAVRKIAAEMDDSNRSNGIPSMADVLSESTSLRRLYARLVELMAGIALFLSTIGIYGLVSHSVAQRTGEIGLRIAIGAATTDILRLVLSQGGKLIVGGLGAGLALSLNLNHFLASYLFGIDASDPGTMAAACSLLIVVAGDPMVALRHD
jgi:putative ABC transport system permease protein